MAKKKAIKKQKRSARVRAYRALMLIAKHPKIRDLQDQKALEQVTLAVECLSREYPDLPELAAVCDHNKTVGKKKKETTG